MWVSCGEKIGDRGRKEPYVLLASCLKQEMKTVVRVVELRPSQRRGFAPSVKTSFQSKSAESLRKQNRFAVFLVAFSIIGITQSC